VAKEAKAQAPDPQGEEAGSEEPRRRFALEDTGFEEVPPRYRRFYRRWDGPGDVLGPNEALCPVCKMVIRSPRELRPGDRLYCVPCKVRLTVLQAPGGGLEARVAR
jgi:hypothetical protein